MAQTGGMSKWLIENQDNQPVSVEANEFLKSLSGSFDLLYCKYEGSKLKSSHRITSQQFRYHQEEWQSNVKARRLDRDSTALDIEIDVSLKTNFAYNSGIAVKFEFNDWSINNFVMLPAAVYNGNRIQIVQRAYAQGLERKYLYKKDIPMMSVPIPHLSNERDVISRLEVNSSNLATPTICFFSQKNKRGFIVLAKQGTAFGDNGFTVEESIDRKKAAFVITAPGVREQKPLFVGFTHSSDSGGSFKSNDSIKLSLRLYSFEADNIPELFDKFMEVRKEVTGSNQPRNLIPFSQIKNWMTERIDSRWFEGEKFKFYRPENADWISFGWIGGLMNTFPMLALGDDLHLQRVSNTFDFAIPRGQGLSGYFYGALNYDGKPFGREGYNEFPEIVLTRKNADVLFWMIKQFNLLKSQGRAKAINPQWEYHIKRLADAFVKTWKKNGQWGNFLNNQSGDIAVFNTSSGVMAIGGLALASKYYHEEEYLNVATEAANFYYERDFLNQGWTTGGCADILQNADSETAAGFMNSLMTLYETTGDDRWLEKSRNLANLVATWTTSYDYELPEETELYQLGARLTGAYWASTQNKHSAPGICTSSGVSLFKIYRATRLTKYADLLNDIIHAYSESIRPDGKTNERLTYCDAELESVGERGNHVTGWNELNGFLMSLEIPGIYLRTDENSLYVFDQVNAKIINQDNKGTVLKIENSTKFDAHISIFAESSQQATSPLDNTGFLNWPKTFVKAGKSKTISLNSNGKIVPSK